jgi:hypothetical protein
VRRGANKNFKASTAICDLRLRRIASATPERSFRNSLDMKPSILSILIAFALVENAQAVSPPPDGGYPRWQHRGGTKHPDEPYHRHIQHGSWNIFGSKPHRRQLLHGRGCWGASCQQRRSASLQPKSEWRCLFSQRSWLVSSPSVTAMPIPTLFLRRRKQQHPAGRDPEPAAAVTGPRLKLAYLVCQTQCSCR